MAVGFGLVANVAASASPYMGYGLVETIQEQGLAGWWTLLFSLE